MIDVLRYALWAASSAIILCIGVFLVLALLCTLLPQEDQDEEP